MALDAYTFGLTALEITEQCETLGGSPKLNLHPTTGVAPVDATQFRATPAYRQLRVIVTELYTQYEWPFLATAVPVNIVGRESPLPDDFWRIRFPNPLILVTDTQRTIVRHLSPDQFFKRGLQTQASTPCAFTIDKHRSSLFLDPPPNDFMVGELHYYRRPNFDSDDAPDKLTDVSDVVRFPHSDLLIQQLLAWYYQQQDDNRWQQAKAQAAEMLERIRSMADDDRDSSACIPLDSQLFGPCFDE